MNHINFFSFFVPMPFQKSAMPRSISVIIFILFVFHNLFSLIYIFFLFRKDENHKINGLRSLSIDQLSFLKSEAFSILKRESKGIVACKFEGDSLLCSNKNCSLLVFWNITFRPFLNLEIINGTQKTTPNNNELHPNTNELQIVLLSIFFKANLSTIYSPKLSKSLI